MPTPSIYLSTCPPVVAGICTTAEIFTALLAVRNISDVHVNGVGRSTAIYIFVLWTTNFHGISQ